MSHNAHCLTIPTYTLHVTTLVCPSVRLSTTIAITVVATGAV